MNFQRCFLIISLILLFVGCSKESQKSSRPNIVLIYADDLGIGLLSHEGQSIITTPNIDKIAQEGIQFNRAYSNMFCAPARASLLSGMHDCHTNRFQITSGKAYLNATSSNLDSIEKSLNHKLSPTLPSQVFLAQIAKAMGYKTAQFGKLDWGFSTTNKQLKAHGWDYYLGYLDHVRAHGFYPPFLFENGEIFKVEGNTHLDCAKTGEPETREHFLERWDMKGKKIYSQDIFMKGALDFIASNKNNPFFLYFPTQLPHGPVAIPEVHPDFKNDSRLTQIEKEYASMVKMLDDNVGQIFDKLKEEGIDENTLVIFTSDNGHEIYYSQEGRVLKPYTNMQTGEHFDNFNRKYYSDLGGDVFDGNGGRAGLKQSNLEGGIRVPLYIRWPKEIDPGSRSNRLTANYDLLATVADITGYNKAFKSDGISFYSELTSEDTSEAHKFIVYSSFQGPTLITSDGWKIRSYLPKNAFELYYLPEDPKEANNLAEIYPEKLEDLKSNLLDACEGELENGLMNYSKIIK